MRGEKTGAFGRTHQNPMNFGKGKRSLRTQFGALCYRMRKGEPEVLLITSRRTKRWILPKGWPMDGMTPVEAAAQEAWEEAGIKGKSKDLCVGLYCYQKALENRFQPCMVAVFPLKVKEISSEFPEKGQRRRKWFSLKKAAAKVREPELKQILSHFNPKALKGI